MMETVSVKKNYFYNTLYQILILITPLITAPYTARVLGANGIGIQSYVNSVASYFVIFAALGTSIYGQREISACRMDPQKVSKLFWEIELLSVVSTAICLVVWIVLIICSKVYSAYYLVLTMTVVAVAFDISWFFMGLENFKYIVLRNTVVRLIGIVLLFTFVRHKSDLLLYVGLTAATGLLGNISMWTYLPKYLVTVDPKTLRIGRHFHETLIYFIPTLALSVYTILDKTMIGLITKDPFENGYYEQAQKIVTMLTTVIFSLNTVMSSRMSYLYSCGKTKEIKEKLRKSLDFSMLLGIPMMFGVAGIAVNFVPLFFGKGYDKTVKLIWICSPLIVITAISNMIGQEYLVPSGQRARSSKAIIVSAVVNFFLNLFMIPRFESIGAAIASVIAELLVTIMYVYMSDEFLTWRMIGESAGCRLAAGGAMLVAVLLLGLCGLHGILLIILQITIGALVYGIILLLAKDKFLLECLQYGRKYVKQK